MHKLRLEGCTSEPLMGYLKALGVLRLLAGQRSESEEIYGSWQGKVFVLESYFDPDNLVHFFLYNYQPTPFLAPWNGGSGFYVKLDVDKFLRSRGSDIVFKSREAVEAINTVECSSIPRLEKYKNQIIDTKRAMTALGNSIDLQQTLKEPIHTFQTDRKKAKDQATKILNDLLLFHTPEGLFAIGKAEKDTFLAELRSKVLTEDGLLWLDAALGIRTGQKKNRVENPTLGSGGNIGNSDFSARFAQMLHRIIPFKDGDRPPKLSESWLKASIYGIPTSGLPKTSVDQFDPGKAGGANGTQGMEAEPSLNPWDYVLMLEGTLALGGSSSRRLGAGRDAASFPFVVDSSSVGYGSAAREKTRGELWLPLWDQPCSYGEIQLLLSEGRAEIGRQQAWSGLTFAQAVAGLGVDRGIHEFVRYEFQERLGQSYLATPIGQFSVPKKPVAGIELVWELNRRLGEFRAKSSDDKVPARFSSALRRIDTVIFDFCKYGGNHRLANILAALGNIERELAVGDLPNDKRKCRPLGGLSSGWLTACDDGSCEFRLARSLAFLHSDPKEKWHIRRYLEPTEYHHKQNSWGWTERGGHVVWSGGDLLRNLGAVLTRRVMDAESSGEEPLPLGSRFPVSLSDIDAFLSGTIDERRLEDLLWGLILIDPKDAERPHRRETGNFVLPRAYALLKLTLLPGRLGWEKVTDPSGESHVRLQLITSSHAEDVNDSELDTDGGISVKPEPAILAQLRTGNIHGACEVAARRLWASGFTPLARHLPDGSRRKFDLESPEVSPNRLLASLLFPIPKRSVDKLADLVLRRPAVETVM